MVADGDRNNYAQQAFDEAIAQHFDSATIPVCLASAKDRFTQPDFRSLEMTRTLANRFREIIQAFCRKQRQDQKRVDEYSIDQSPGDGLIQWVDLGDYPEAQNHVDGLLSPGNFPPFKNEEKFAKNLRFYAIVAQLQNGQTVIGLRSITQAQKPYRSKWSVRAFLQEGRHEYDELTTELLLFDEEIDCLLYKNLVFISNGAQFEKIFNFEQVSRRVATKALSMLEQSVQIHNFEEFKAACLRDRRKQKQLARIARGADLSQFTVPKAREVMKVNRYVKGIIRTEGGEEILTYDPRNQWALLRFLNETTVMSLVTGDHFDADHKRAL